MPAVKRGDLNLTPLQLMNPEIKATQKKINGITLHQSNSETKRQTGQQQLMGLHNIFPEET